MNASNPKSVIMVKDDPTLEKAAGAMVYWRLSGGVKRDELIDAFSQIENETGAAMPEDDLPPEITTLAALSAVMQRVAVKHKMFARSFGKNAYAIATKEGMTAQAVGAFPIVVQAGLAGFAHAQPHMVEKLRAFSRRDNEKIGKKDDPTHVTIAACSRSSDFDAIRDEILDALPAARDTYDSNDIGAWLVDKAKEIGGVPLREGGGIYFIPKPALDAWRRLAGALKIASRSSIVYEIPALDSKGAVAAICDALAMEADEAIGQLDEAMKKVGPRGMKTIATNKEALDRKLTQYEELLGVRLEELREKLEGLQYRLGVAQMATTKDEEKDAAQ